MTMTAPRIGRALARSARRPLVHFLLIGAALYAGQDAVERRDVASSTTIRIDAAQLEDFRRDWALRNGGRPPDAAALGAAVRGLADEEMLYREALRLGLDRSDPVVRSRLIANLRFVEAFSSEAPRSDAARLRAAYALGMDRQDYVVRARLIEVMRQRLGRGVSVSTSEARRYLAQHPSAVPGAQVRYRFTQVFFSDDRRGRAAERDAHAALGALQSGEPAQAVDGDAFLLGRSFAGTRRQIADRLGRSLAAAVAQAPIGRWDGPVRSVYGWHLLRVEAVERLQADPAEALRRAYYAALEERRQQALEQGLQALRQRYRVVVSGPNSAAISVAAASSR